MMVKDGGKEKDVGNIHLSPNNNNKKKTNLRRRQYKRSKLTLRYGNKHKAFRDTALNQQNIPHQSRLWCFNMNLLAKELQIIRIATSLMDNDICVVDQFLSDDIAKRLSKTTQFLFKEIPGLFTEPLNTHTHTKFRHDLTCWVNGTENFCQCYSEANALFTNAVKDVLREYNAQKASTVKVSHKSRIQISCFPGNSPGYLPHVDDPKNSGRVLTLVYYPNEKYDPEEYGGKSKFYVRNRTRCIEVEPRNNRLVLYWSDSRVITETLPTRTENVFALTCWFFGPEHSMILTN